MTWLDWTVAAFVTLGALFGLWKGAVRQVAGWLASMGAILVPWLFAGAAAHALEPLLGAPYPLTFLFSALALALISYVVVRLVAGFLLSRFITRAGSDDEEATGLLPSGVDRLLGALVGGAKSALVLWVVVSLMALVVSGLQERKIGALGLEKSPLLQLSLRHNALGLAFGGRLEALSEALKAQKSKAAPKAQTAMAELLNDPRLRRISADGALLKSLQSGDILSLVRSPDLLSVLNDPSAMKKVQTVVSGAGEQVEKGLVTP